MLDTYIHGREPAGDAGAAAVREGERSGYRALWRSFSLRLSLARSLLSSVFPRSVFLNLVSLIFFCLSFGFFIFEIG